MGIGKYAASFPTGQVTRRGIFSLGHRTKIFNHAARGSVSFSAARELRWCFQNESILRLAWMQRKARTLSAPGSLQNMPDCLHRFPMSDRQPASTTPEHQCARRLAAGAFPPVRWPVWRWLCAQGLPTRQRRVLWLFVGLWRATPSGTVLAATTWSSMTTLEKRNFRWDSRRHRSCSNTTARWSQESRPQRIGRWSPNRPFRLKEGKTK